MTLQAFTEIRFNEQRLAMIGQLNRVIADYQRQGFVLTVRQLYYQCVARGWVENTLRSYKNMASLINDARMAGHIDWDAIEDRTREFSKRLRWTSGRERIEAAAKNFHMDMWETQPRRVFVLVEKEALTGVLQQVCWNFDVPLLACRGYPSASVLYDFAMQDLDDGAGGHSLILHLGDHDPSGLDMTRDLQDRLTTFTYSEANFEIRRIALNMDQVDEQKPPPNPAKTTDARFKGYRSRFGSSSWELDALSPSYLVKLLEEHISAEIDRDEWEARSEQIDGTRDKMLKVAANFTD